MARINNLTNFLIDVAAAIKEKKSSETDIPAVNFDTEILNLPSQGTYQQKTINITQNGSQTITPDTDYDAIDELIINTNIPLQARNYTFNSNTTTTLTPEQGYAGFSEVGITIDVGDDPTTATANDLLSPKTAYSNGQKITGTIMPITEISDIDYISFDLQSNNIVAVDYANKYCVKRTSDTTLEFYKFNGDGLIEDSKIEMTVGEASAETRLIAYSFSNYNDNDGYVWLYTASIKLSTSSTDDNGKKIYINVFRIDVENQTYDVFGNVSVKLTEYATTRTSGHYLKIAPRPNKNQFCVCGWLNDVSSGTYGTWVSLLINVTTSNTVTITRYTGIDTGRQRDATNQYVRCYYSSDGEYLYLNGELTVNAYGGQISVDYAVLRMTETNTVLSTIKSYSKTIAPASYDGGPTPLGLYTTYVMQGKSVYNVSDLENPIATDVLPFDTTRNRNVFVLNRYILYVSGATLNVYEFNPDDLTVTLYDTRVFDGSITNILPISEKQVVYFYNNSVKGYIMADDVIITGLVRNGKTFLDISKYTLPANMAVQGYSFANSSGSQVGTMPNNGTLLYNPSTSQQTIPAGYTSGGTIAAISADIDPDFVPENIKAGVNIFGTTGELDADSILMPRIYNGNDIETTNSDTRTWTVQAQLDSYCYVIVYHRTTITEFTSGWTQFQTYTQTGDGNTDYITIFYKKATETTETFTVTTDNSGVRLGGVILSTMYNYTLPTVVYNQSPASQTTTTSITTRDIVICSTYTVNTGYYADNWSINMPNISYPCRETSNNNYSRFNVFVPLNTDIGEMQSYVASECTRVIVLRFPENHRGTDLIASNIKKGVTIFGVTGTYEGPDASL